ncbi:MAG: hypothetical protein AAFQ07_03515, partial [Chloroflexota bacterium]
MIYTTKLIAISTTNKLDACKYKLRLIKQPITAKSRVLLVSIRTRSYTGNARASANITAVDGY